MKNSPFKISLLITLVHCILGNVVAFYETNKIVEIIFIPYTFIAGMSNFAGWDTLSYILELVSFSIVFLIVYTIARFLFKKATLGNQKK